MDNSEWTLPWGDGMGIPELDAADRRINALLHELGLAIAGGSDRDEIQRLMRQILHEALSHFELEERTLMESAYPQPKGHAALHLQMRAELEYAMEELRHADGRALWAEYGLLITQLFVEHMRQEAVKYREFLRSNSGSDPQGT